VLLIAVRKLLTSREYSPGPGSELDGGQAIVTAASFATSTSTPVSHKQVQVQAPSDSTRSGASKPMPDFVPLKSSKRPPSSVLFNFPAQAEAARTVGTKFLFEHMNMDIDMDRLIPMPTSSDSEDASGPGTLSEVATSSSSLASPSPRTQSQTPRTVVLIDILSSSDPSSLSNEQPPAEVLCLSSTEASSSSILSLASSSCPVIRITIPCPPPLTVGDEPEDGVFTSRFSVYECGRMVGWEEVEIQAVKPIGVLSSSASGDASRQRADETEESVRENARPISARVLDVQLVPAFWKRMHRHGLVDVGTRWKVVQDIVFSRSNHHAASESAPKMNAREEIVQSVEYRFCSSATYDHGELENNTARSNTSRSLPSSSSSDSSQSTNNMTSTASPYTAASELDDQDGQYPPPTESQGQSQQCDQASVYGVPVPSDSTRWYPKPTLPANTLWREEGEVPQTANGQEQIHYQYYHHLAPHRSASQQEWDPPGPAQLSVPLRIPCSTDTNIHYHPDTSYAHYHYHEYPSLCHSNVSYEGYSEATASDSIPNYFMPTPLEANYPRVDIAAGLPNMLSEGSSRAVAFYPSQNDPQHDHNSTGTTQTQTHSQVSSAQHDNQWTRHRHPHSHPLTGPRRPFLANTCSNVNSQPSYAPAADAPVRTSASSAESSSPSTYASSQAEYSCNTHTTYTRGHDLNFQYDY
jgi:hypothetical protein